MKNKKFILGLLVLALLPLNACDGGKGDNPEPPVPPAPVLPETLADVKAYVEALQFNKYELFTYQRKDAPTYDGDVWVGDQEIVFDGSYSLDTSRTRIIIYNGYEQSEEEVNLYYHINTIKDEYGKQVAKRKKVVSADNKTDDSLEITVEDAKQEIDNALFSRAFLASKFNPFFNEGVSLEAKLMKNDESKYQVVLSYVAETTVYNLSLDFSVEGNVFLQANYHVVDWGEENFDKETNLPLDDTQNPVNYEDLRIGEFKTEEVTLSKGVFYSDRTSYFVHSLTGVRVYGHDSYNGDDPDGKATVGKYIDFEITGYEPKSAINVDEFKIVDSSDQSVVQAGGGFSAKAVKAGKATLTISDKLGLCTYSAEIEVVTPPAPAASSVKIKYGTKYDVALDATQTIFYEMYPANTEDEVEVTSSNESVLQIVSVDNKARSFVVKGVGEGTSSVVISVKGSTVKSTAKTFTVKKVDASVDWLVGEWLIQNVSSIDASFTFKADGTGTIKIEDDDTGTIRGTFSYTYDGINLVLTNVKAEKSGYTIRVDSIKVNAAKDTLTITAYYEDDMDDFGRISGKNFKQED